MESEVAEPRGGVLTAMAAVLEDQASVARAEVALAAAKRRLAASTQRLQLVSAGVGVAMPEAAGETLRVRIVEALEARAGEVLTTAAIAVLVGATNRDSVRNTLLVLAAKDRIEKVGLGLYRARGAAG